MAEYYQFDLKKNSYLGWIPDNARFRYRMFRNALLPISSQRYKKAVILFAS